MHKKYLKDALEEMMKMGLDILQMLMAARDKEKVNVRWPLQKAEVHVPKEFDVKKMKDFVPLLLKQANLKELVFVAAKKESNVEMHVVLDLKQTPALEAEGFSREIMRRVQALRKEAGLQRENSIVLSLFVEGVDLSVWKKQIVERCGAKKVSFVKVEKMKHHSEGDIKEKKFFIGFDVL